MGWEVVSEGPGHRFAAVGNVLITLYWQTPVDGQPLKDRLPWAESAIEEHGWIAQIVIVDRSFRGTLPGPEYRSVSREHSERFGGSVKFSAIVFEPNDAKMTLIRALIRGLTLTLSLGRGYGIEFFDDVRRAARFCASQDTKCTAEDLLAAIDAIRPPQ